MKDIHTLLKLLRFASFQDYVLPDTLLSDNIDWRAVYALALHQGISAIVLDGIGRLPKEIRPSKPILLQWIGQGTMMEQMYAKHRGIISSLASVFAKDGIRMLLLKGYGCSLCYKKPEHRPTGDIDVYLFESIQRIEQRAFLPGTDRRVSMQEGDGRLYGTLKVGENQDLLLNIDTKHNNPKTWNYFHDNILLEDSIIDIQDFPFF